MASVMSPPFSLASDFCREPRWSMAAAAMTPRSFETFLRPASLPGVIFIGSSRIAESELRDEDECAERIIVNQVGRRIGAGVAIQSSSESLARARGGIPSRYLLPA